MAESSYKQIFKATGIFGGVQVVTVLLGIVKTKLLAVWLGMAGIGINALFTSTLGLINALVNVGIQSSAVKEVAESQATGDRNKIRTSVTVVRRLVTITGLAGALSVFVFSAFLSELVFHNRDYTVAFKILSLSLFFDQLTTGQLAILQGLRKLSYLARANMIGSLLGVVIAVPLYYFCGIRGIVPAIVLSSFFLLLRSWYYARKTGIKNYPLSWQATMRQSRPIVRIGLALSVSNFIGLGALYLIRIYLNRKSGIDTVGLYNAGMTLADTYVGMIFTAMATDYFPRLTAVNKESRKFNSLVRQQAEMSLIIVFPLLLGLGVLLDPVIRLLYSVQFLPVGKFVMLAIPGIAFKTMAFPVGYTFIAKGHKYIFLISEFLSWSYMVAGSLIGFHYWGLAGLGAGYTVSYFLCLWQCMWLAKFFYRFSFGPVFSRLAWQVTAVLLFSLLINRFVGGTVGMLCNLVLFFYGVWFSWREFKKRIDWKDWIKSIRRK